MATKKNNTTTRNIALSVGIKNGEAAVLEPRKAEAEHQRLVKEAETLLAANNPEAVQASLVRLRTQVATLLSNIGTSVDEQYRIVEALQRLATDKAQEIERLYNIEVEAAVFEARKSALETELAELEAARDQATTEWNEAEQARQADAQRREAAQLEQRRRDAEQYDYQRLLKERNDNDAWERAKKEKERAFNAAMQAVEQDLLKRGEVLKASEQEFKALRDAVAGFDDRLKAATKEAAAAAASAAHRDAKTVADLERSKLAGELALAQQARAQAEASVTLLQQRLKELEAKVDDSRTMVADMARAAFTEAGASRALSEIQRSDAATAVATTKR